MALEDDIRRLSRISLFRALETDALRLIAFGAEARIMRAGDVLFRKGEKSDAGFIVLSGSLVLDEASDGRSPARIVQPECLIGENALLVETERVATAIAREPSTILKISRELFHRVLREYPASAMRLHAAMTDELRSFVRQLEKVTLGRTE
ncbi:MAG: cyclic nucleotide-binding domain-containing protein [Methylobacteriaceae bacterium]|nr:cyclic nucleotide-binding domain-containing protein [Methylobacteriaceae bacterium]